LFVKTLLLFLSALLICRYETYAQQTEVIIRVGPNLSQLRGNQFSNDIFQSQFGCTAGGFIRHSINSHLFLSGGLQYETNGYKIPDLIFVDQSGNNLIGGDVQSKFNFFVLPLMVEYGAGSKVKFSIKGGSFVSYLLNKKTIVKYDDGNESVIADKDQHRFNFGLGAGTAVYFPLNKKLQLELNVEDHLGLTNVYNKNLSRGYLKTNALNLTAGLVYSLN
jgi:hypothetical protein